MTVKWMNMAEAAEFIGARRAGKATNRSTVHRWATAGLNGVVLRTQVRGSIRMTRPKWIRLFFDLLTEARGPAQQPALPSSPAKRRRSYEQARRRLEAAGAI